MPSSAVRELARSVLPDRILRTWRGWRRREPLPAFLADGAGTIESPRMRPEPRRGLRGSRALRDTALRCARNGVIAAWWRAFCESLGIEAGLPLLERRVVDLVVGVPEHTHRKAPRDRALERAAYADLLPEAVLVRPKDQPRVENAAAQAIRTYGGAWWERWVAGGAMERGGRLGAKQSREILERLERRRRGRLSLPQPRESGGVGRGARARSGRAAGRGWTRVGMSAFGRRRT